MELMDRLFRGEIPQTYGIRAVGARQPAPILAERDSVYLRGMAVEQNNRLERLRVPDACRRVPADRDQELAVGMPGEPGDVIGVPRQAADIFAGGEIPKTNGLVFTGG